MNTAAASPFQSTAVAPVRPSLVGKFAAKYSIESEKLLSILKATAFKQQSGEVSNEQMAALLVVADQHGLNPFTREIFAFADKYKGVVPVVSVDGWARIINDHPQSDGLEFRCAEEMESIEGAQPCPIWMEVVIYRKDRNHPIVVREYLDEVYRPPRSGFDGPWQSHTKRMMRHKTLIQGARLAYGFSGIYDEDEAHRIIEGEVVVQQGADPLPVEPPKTAKDALRRAAEGGGKRGKKDDAKKKGDGGPQASAAPSVTAGAAAVDPSVVRTPDTLLADVKRCCEKALGTTDGVLAKVALDDARDLSRALEGQHAADAKAAVDSAAAELAKRFEE
jgi:phage recombination protein Bet